MLDTPSLAKGPGFCRMGPSHLKILQQHLMSMTFRELFVLMRIPSPSMFTVAKRETGNRTKYFNNHLQNFAKWRSTQNQRSRIQNQFRISSPTLNLFSSRSQYKKDSLHQMWLAIFDLVIQHFMSSPEAKETLPCSASMDSICWLTEDSAEKLAFGTSLDTWTG